VDSEIRMRFETVHNGPSGSSKVVDFSTNRKRVCDFLLVTNSSLGHIVLRFRDVAGFLLRRATPYSTRLLWVFPLDRAGFTLNRALFRKNVGAPGPLIQ